MTIAARLIRKAGAPGFEPGIAGPKPAALPLGYAPPRLWFTQTRSYPGRTGKARALSGSASQATPRHLAMPHRVAGEPCAHLQSLVAGAEQEDQRDHGEKADDDQRQRPHDQH